MISEKQLSISYSAFWNQLIPRAEEYLRKVNRGLERYTTPYYSSLPPEARGAINELAFQLFSVSIATNLPVPHLSDDVVAAATVRTVDYIRRFREHSRAPVPYPTQDEVNEARDIGIRIGQFIRSEHIGALTIRPLLPGCGWVDACEGDVLLDGTLVEIKAGDRGFRSTDVRQVLVYCALNYVARTYVIDRVCLVNPRVGVYHKVSLEALSRDLSGRSAGEVLGDLVQLMTEPIDDYSS